MKSIKAFGAKGDGKTDDTIAVKNALISNQPLEIPEGIYLIKSDIVIENANIFLEGSGSGQTIFLFDKCNGFKFNLNKSEYWSDIKNTENFVIKNIAFHTNSDQYTGLVIASNNATQSANSPILLDSVVFAGITTQTTYWKCGLYLLNVGKTTIRTARIHGPIFLNRGAIGIQYEGRNVSATEHTLIDAKIVGCSIGVLVGGRDRQATWVEGLLISSCQIVACFVGLYGATEYKPQINIMNSHINAWHYGLYFDKVTQSTIANNLFYISSADIGSHINHNDPTVGIFLTGHNYISSDVIISGNQILHQPGPVLQNGTGIKLDNVRECIITSNIIKLFNKGIESNNDNTFNLINNNLFPFCTSIS